MFGIVLDVPAPIEVYDTMHAQLKNLKDTATDLPEGCLVHVDRATAGGFQIMEVWESRDQFERGQRELIAPLSEKLNPGTAVPPEQMRGTEFEVRGIVIPGAGIFL